MEHKKRSGNPNPSPSTRFNVGDRPNPNGKTSEQKKNEMRAAELASKVTLDWMQAISNLVDSAGGDDAKLAELRSDTLNLVKEANNRAFGTPKSSVDLSSDDGSMTPPSTIAIVGVDPITDDNS